MNFASRSWALGACLVCSALACERSTRTDRVEEPLRTPAPKARDATPALDAGVVYVAGCDEQLRAFDAATGAVVTAKDGSVADRTLINPDTNDIAPRVGIIWRPAERLVIRGGYGIFYQQADRYGSESQLGLNLPQLVDASITSNSGADAPAFTFAQGFTPLTPQTVNPTVVQWRIQDPDQDTPRVQQFSIGPEF